jgi:hypothetical protein
MRSLERYHQIINEYITPKYFQHLMIVIVFILPLVQITWRLERAFLLVTIPNYEIKFDSTTTFLDGLFYVGGFILSGKYNDKNQ